MWSLHHCLLSYSLSLHNSWDGVPENKAVLLSALSDLGGLLRPARTFQSFVVSSPLQTDLWLLCCLRPLSCTLAFWRPFRVKQFQSSPVPRGRVRATRSLPAIRRVSRGRTLTDV